MNWFPVRIDASRPSRARSALAKSGPRRQAITPTANLTIAPFLEHSDHRIAGAGVVALLSRSVALQLLKRHGEPVRVLVLGERRQVDHRPSLELALLRKPDADLHLVLGVCLEVTTNRLREGTCSSRSLHRLAKDIHLNLPRAGSSRLRIDARLDSSGRARHAGSPVMLEPEIVTVAKGRPENGGRNGAGRKRERSTDLGRQFGRSSVGCRKHVDEASAIHCCLCLIRHTYAHEALSAGMEESARSWRWPVGAAARCCPATPRAPSARAIAAARRVNVGDRL